MVFHSLAQDETGLVMATATGHATEVVETFRKVCSLLLSGRGAWRICSVRGEIGPTEEMDSEMHWTLMARPKRQ